MGARRGMRGTVALAVAAVGVLTMTSSAVAVPPGISATGVSGVTGTSATLEADLNPNGSAVLYHFEYGETDCASNPCTSTPEGELLAGTSPVRVKATAVGLVPGSIYHFRLVAKNGKGETSEGPDRIFATPFEPLGGLPDNRAYEQATPIDKNGGDAVGKAELVKAASVGGGITFGSTFGIPGGKGAQALPLYLGSRGASGWSTQGLLPPASFGERAQILGWLPDLSMVFSTVTKLGSPRRRAFLAQPTDGSEPTVIVPLTASAEYTYVGAADDGSVVLFSSQAKLPPKEGEPPLAEALEGSPNLYAWDAGIGRLSLAGVQNDLKAPAKGALAGASGSGTYLEDLHAVTPDGSVYFTARGLGQLFLRLNPTAAQSPLDGEENCTDPALACTVHVSASQRVPLDPAGTQRATFQAASEDGSEVFFTSPEKLTDDANTGPEQPPAAIHSSNLAGEEEDPDFIPTHAVGVAVDSEYVYWTDPSLGTIGRAELDGSEIESEFIVPGPVKFETEPGVFEEVESLPRYLAVDSEHVYWTNTGRTDKNGKPINEGGTIGRAEIDGTEADPDCIVGASNPQGIGLSPTRVYWANSADDPAVRSIARANLACGEVEQKFSPVSGQPVPYGLAVDGIHVYFTKQDEGNDNGRLARIPLEGGVEEAFVIGKAGTRGVAVDATHAYWATQGEGAIGRIALAEFPVAGLCTEVPGCEKGFIEVTGSPGGVAADAAHLYWSVNGEAPTNPGNDLYRYRPLAGESGELVDLAPDPDDTNGADVVGVLGASPDGSHVYFAANGDLDGAGPAELGDCEGETSKASGACSLYLWEEGAVSFVAPLKATAKALNSDTFNWAPTQRLPGGNYGPRTARVADDGTLLFRSQEQLTAYDNEEVPELYRYDPEEGLSCVSCNPSGEAVGAGPGIGSIQFPGLSPLSSAAVSSRFLSADGNRAFFETAEALSPTDTNGQGGCPPSGSPSQLFPACLDVYEWEAPNTGSCKEASPSYSPLNDGCVYLISTGKSEFPSLFADASQSGDDVYFFTRDQLVGQDKDGLQDIYDARVGGGLASQNPPPAPLPCESTDSCHGPLQVPPAEAPPTSQAFVGPGDPVPVRKKAKKHHKKKHKKHKKKQQKNKKAQRSGGANRGAGR